MDYQEFESYNFYNSHAFNVFTDADSRSYRNHWHTYGEIILVGGGDSNIYRVNQSSYDLDEGDIVLIWPMEQHEIIDADRKTSIVVQFGNSFAESLFDMQRIMHYFHDLHIIRKSRHGETVNALTLLIREMKDIYYSEGRNRELRGCMKLMEFMLVLDDHRRELINDIGTDRQGIVPDETFKKMVEVTDFIKNNLATEDLSQTAMAGRAGISNEYFSRVFKELTGINYNRWLNMIRVDKAISLFENDSMKLTEIAMLSGFQSIPSFNRVFKELKGIAPGEYRNMNMQSSEPRR